MANHISPQVDQFDGDIELQSQTGPFAIVPMWIFHHDLTPSELNTWISIRALGGGVPMVMRHATIARTADRAVGTVDRAISRLLRLGVLTATSTDGGIAYLAVDVDPRRATTR